MPIIPDGAYASIFLLILPWPLLALGTLSFFGLERRLPLFKKMMGSAAAFAFTAAALGVLSFELGQSQSLTFLSLPLPGDWGAVEVRVGVNPLTLVIAFLVAFVGLAVVRFSERYLDGDPGEGRFYRWLTLTLGFFFTMVVVDNMWAFFLSWVTMTLCFQKLLNFYPERVKASLAARKKFLLDRVSDGLLFGGIFLVVRTLHTDHFSGLASAVSAHSGSFPESFSAAGLLIIAVTLLKSAQFPFQGWLIQVMEAPTPVSALMHAGIIYTGTILYLRCLPVVRSEVVGRDLLIGFGLMTVVVGALAMMIANNIKESLAYSTSAQIGFMIIECGLGVMGVAVMHIIAHSVYKAHAFLSSGSVTEFYRGPKLRLSPKAGGAPGRILPALGIGILVSLSGAWVFGIDLKRQPALLLLGMILSVALARLLLTGLSARTRSRLPLLIPAVGLATAVALAAFGLHRLFDRFLDGSIPALALLSSPIQIGILVAVAGTFLWLLWVEESLPARGGRPFWKTMYVHLGRGFYSDVLLDRLLEGKHPRNPEIGGVF